ncbi:MAG: hypothetical protein JKY54_05635 [Flavobacteriales bacterium]|nr:hypothetical protein [Flavobacteriales bacterium]
MAEYINRKDKLNMTKQQPTVHCQLDSILAERQQKQIDWNKVSASEVESVNPALN